MQQLSGLDASFLHLETAEMPMHVGALSVYELPREHRGDFATELRAHIASRLPLVLVSGVFEILGGVGLLPTRSRRFAAFGLMALYVAVFPANVRMAMDPEAFHVSAAVAYGRLPFQLLVLAWAFRYTRAAGARSDEATQEKAT